jgi:hypothetical protein
MKADFITLNKRAFYNNLWLAILSDNKTNAEFTFILDMIEHP